MYKALLLFLIFSFQSHATVNVTITIREHYECTDFVALYEIEFFNATNKLTVLDIDGGMTGNNPPENLIDGNPSEHKFWLDFSSTDLNTGECKRSILWLSVESLPTRMLLMTASSKSRDPVALSVEVCASLCSIYDFPDIESPPANESGRFAYYDPFPLETNATVYLDADYFFTIPDSSTEKNFLAECSDLFAPVRCVAVSPGSLVLKIRGPSANVEHVLSEIAESGLQVPGFPILSILVTTPPTTSTPSLSPTISLPSSSPSVSIPTISPSLSIPSTSPSFSPSSAPNRDNSCSAYDTSDSCRNHDCAWFDSTCHSTCQLPTFGIQNEAIHIPNANLRSAKECASWCISHEICHAFTFKFSCFIWMSYDRSSSSPNNETLICFDSFNEDAQAKKDESSDDQIWDNMIYVAAAAGGLVIALVCCIIGCYRKLRGTNRTMDMKQKTIELSKGPKPTLHKYYGKGPKYSTDDIVFPEVTVARHPNSASLSRPRVVSPHVRSPDPPSPISSEILVGNMEDGTGSPPVHGPSFEYSPEIRNKHLDKPPRLSEHHKYHSPSSGSSIHTVDIYPVKRFPSTTTGGRDIVMVQTESRGKRLPSARRGSTNRNESQSSLPSASRSPTRRSDHRKTDTIYDTHGYTETRVPFDSVSHLPAIPATDTDIMSVATLDFDEFEPRQRVVSAASVDFDQFSEITTDTASDAIRKNSHSSTHYSEGDKSQAEKSSPVETLDKAWNRPDIEKFKMWTAEATAAIASLENAWTKHDDLDLSVDSDVEVKTSNQSVDFGAIVKKHVLGNELIEEVESKGVTLGSDLENIDHQEDVIDQAEMLEMDSASSLDHRDGSDAQSVQESLEDEYTPINTPRKYMSKEASAYSTGSLGLLPPPSQTNSSAFLFTDSQSDLIMDKHMNSSELIEFNSTNRESWTENQNQDSHHVPTLSTMLRGVENLGGGNPLDSFRYDSPPSSPAPEFDDFLHDQHAFRRKETSESAI